MSGADGRLPRGVEDVLRRERAAEEHDRSMAETLAAIGELHEETKRGRGRPAIGPLLGGVRLEPATYAELDAIAGEEGVPRAEVVRELIVEALAARRRKAARRP